MNAKYINPFTDFGFKKIFGEEASKPLLIDFLNALLPEPDKIIDLSFKNIEHLGQTETDRKAIYDIYCENENREKFIVELQKAKQNYFKERTIYYATFPIQEQAEKGEWSYNLKAVYCIGILDFTFDDYKNESDKKEVVHTIKLKNQNGKVFYDKLTYIYLEMPNFKASEADLKTRLDKWLYFIKHLEDFQTIPKIFTDEVFTQAFEKVELANFGQDEWKKYERSLKIFRDNQAVFDYYDKAIETAAAATDVAFDEGRLEGKLEVAKSAKQMGMKVADIIKLTGLTKEAIDKL